MKRKRRLCFLVALVFVFTLFLSNRVVLGYEAEVVEEGDIEMIEDCSDYVSGYETEIVGVYEIEAKDCNEKYVRQELETEEGIESFNDYPVCPFCENHDCLEEDSEAWFLVNIQAVFSEGHRLGSETVKFIIYKDGVESEREVLRWDGERGIATIDLYFPFWGPECRIYTQEWFEKIIGSMTGEVTWRIELPTGLRVIGSTTGTMDFIALSPGIGTEGWSIYNIVFELERVSPPVNNEAPPPSPQTGDSGAPLVFPLISSIFALAAIVLLGKRRIIY